MSRFNKYLAIVLLALIPIGALAQSPIPSNSLTVGPATNVDKKVIFNRNSASKPQVKWNETAGRLAFTDDGSTFRYLSDPFHSLHALNAGLAASVGSNALTISLVTKAGSTPSASLPIYIPFRSSTITSGNFDTVTITAATTLTISSGSTLGQTSAQPSYIWIYAINNSNSVELAASHTKFTDDSLQTTTAEGGAGAADSATVLYSTTARSNVPVYLLGYILNTQATAGTWVSTATQIQLLPSQRRSGPTVQKFTAGSGTYNTPAGVTRIRVRLVGPGGGGAGDSATANNNAGNGGNGSAATTFGTSLLSGGLGSGGTGTTGGNGGAGGTASLGSGPIGIAYSGTTGQPGQIGVTGTTLNGGAGGGTPFSGGGPGGFNGAPTTSPPANSGAGGGGGGGTNTRTTGAGGGAGGYIDALIVNPLSSYSYVVGTGGTAGTAGTNGDTGAAGADGVIVVEEFYE